LRHRFDFAVAAGRVRRRPGASRAPLAERRQHRVFCKNFLRRDPTISQPAPSDDAGGAAQEDRRCSGGIGPARFQCCNAFLICLSSAKFIDKHLFTFRIFLLQY
jgi:hypothetical protein